MSTASIFEPAWPAKAVRNNRWFNNSCRVHYLFFVEFVILKVAWLYHLEEPPQYLYHSADCNKKCGKTNVQFQSNPSCARIKLHQTNQTVQGMVKVLCRVRHYLSSNKLSQCRFQKYAIPAEMEAKWHPMFQKCLPILFIQFFVSSKPGDIILSSHAKVRWAVKLSFGLLRKNIH